MLQCADLLINKDNRVFLSRNYRSDSCHLEISGPAKILFFSLCITSMISAASTLMFWYLAAIFDILQRENNRILGGSVIISQDGWAEVDLLRSTTSAAIIKCLGSHFIQYGVQVGLRMLMAPIWCRRRRRNICGKWALASSLTS